MKGSPALLAVMPALAAAVILMGAHTKALAVTVYALTVNNGLFAFDSATPSLPFAPPMPITGINAGQDIVGIDFRPANGQLYALGYNSGSELAQVYTVNVNTAAATAVGIGANLIGAFFSMDFNPVVDRIRVVTSANTNYRFNPDNGALAATDLMLAFAGGGTPLVTGVAYTNNFAGALQTTLYGYEAGSNSLVTIGGPNGVPSPNGGQVFPVGPSGIFAEAPRIGFDIFGNSTAFLSARTAIGPAAIDRFYTADLATGMLTALGTFPLAGVEDIAVIPEPGVVNLAMLALFALLRRRPRQS
ncbi:MAG: DUF4394 domain-containing protein [Verrucomicrobiales bacterium]